MPTVVASLLLADDKVDIEGGIIETRLGSKVVNGVGYDEPNTGPDGLAPDIKATAGYRLALGRMTWPHRLARIMLLEQIYRSVTILVNHPYHRM